MVKKFFFVFFLVCLALPSCKKRPDIDPLLIGSWRYTRANIHNIYSFRANGSFVLQQKVEGRFSRITEKKGEVGGMWDLEGDNDTIFLLMTATKIEGNDEWVKEELQRFEVVEINKLELDLKNDNDQLIKLARVRGKQEEINPEDMGFVVVRPGPIVVNLKNDRAHGKFRFLCIDLEFSVEPMDENDFVSIERLPESEIPRYHLHPKIREVAIFYFSSLTYKDTKSLEKVKKVVDNLKIVLSPYFNGGLNDISVKKVVVTANIQSVKEFEELYAGLAAGEGEEGTTE